MRVPAGAYKRPYQKNNNSGAHTNKRDGRHMRVPALFMETSVPKNTSDARADRAMGGACEYLRYLWKHLYLKITQARMQAVGGSPMCIARTCAVGINVRANANGNVCQH